jgi:FixJ family two-component response regulator
MLKRMLFVDDDPRILQALEREFRKVFEIETALGPEVGLRNVSRDGPYAVVISDLRMPGMNGIEFLTHVKQISPDTVRIILTGNADLNAAIRAVNQGQVFQFLSKPCPSQILQRTLESAVEQYRLITSERDLIEKTLRGSIAVLSEILSLANPMAFSRAQRIHRYVQHMVATMKLRESWQYELAAMLSQVGSVTVPPDLFDKSYRGEPLTSAEMEVLTSPSRIGHDLLAKIPRLEQVAEMVAHQRESWSETAGCSDVVRTGANLLRIATDLDEQVIRGNSLDSIITEMLVCRDYNTGLVQGLQRLPVEQTESQTRLVHLSQLQPQMILNSGIYSQTGRLLLAKGQILTDSAIARLNSFASLFGVVEPISVTVRPAELAKEGVENLRISA